MNPALPGEDLIEKGVRDLREKRETVAALLVAIGALRLRRLEILLPDVRPDKPEHRLYALLARDEPDAAHSRYNALIRRLVIFETTAEHILHLYPSSPPFRCLVDRVLNENQPD